MERSTVDRAPIQLTNVALGASVTQYYPLGSTLGEDRLGGTFLTEYVRAITWADQSGTLTLEDSDNRTTWATVGSSYTVSASTLKETGWVNLTKRYWRWKYVNGGTAQGTFKLFEDKTADNVNVTVATAIPAGTNNIGDVDVLSIAAGTNNIGDVDVLTIAAGDNNIGNVDIASAIPAGANIIGQVGIDQTTPGTTNLVQVGGTLPAFAATPTVDTELPAAAALADAAANPTTPTVGAALKVWNGTTWDNVDGVNTGQLVVTPKGSAGSEVIGAIGAAVPAGAMFMGGRDGSGNLQYVRSSGVADAASDDMAMLTAARNQGYNGTTWDRLRTASSTGAANAGVGNLAVTPHLFGGGTTHTPATAVNNAADAITGPGVQAIGNYTFNGATWDRVRSVNTGQLVTTMKNSSGTEPGILGAGSDIVAANFNALLVNSAMRGYGGTNLELWRNNHTATPFTSAARTATASSADQTNYNGQGVIVTINVSLDPSTASVVFTIEAKDPVSGAYTTVLTSAAIAAVGTTRLRVGPNITPSANVAVADLLGRTWRVTATHADAESITYSVSAETMTA